MHLPVHHLSIHPSCFIRLTVYPSTFTFIYLKVYPSCPTNNEVSIRTDVSTFRLDIRQISRPLTKLTEHLFDREVLFFFYLRKGGDDQCEGYGASKGQVWHVRQRYKARAKRYWASWKPFDSIHLESFSFFLCCMCAGWQPAVSSEINKVYSV